MIFTVILVVLLFGSVLYMILIDPDGHGKSEDISPERRAYILRGLREKRNKKRKKNEK